MTKFINKKEQVYDLKLTSYAHYLLSVGIFKPLYYAFYDDNVLYDGAYAFVTESQNNIHKRIKEETSYLESLVLFRDVEKSLSSSAGGTVDFSEIISNLTPQISIPEADIYRFDAAIGDAWLDAERNKAPAWKIVSLNNEITSSTGYDTVNTSPVPQINITAQYRLKVRNYDFNFNPETVTEIGSTTPMFIDNRVITLEFDDVLIYAEEVNTEMLTKNFDLQVFYTPTGSTTLDRKYFQNFSAQIVNGLMVSDTPDTTLVEATSTGSVEYYFDIVTDMDINRDVACKGASHFNNQSYYVDLDFDCSEEAERELYFDIYGSVTEPEICQD